MEWLEQEPNRLLISVVAPGGGWLVLSDTWYPGWRASIDGVEVPIYPADAVFRALRLPKGEYEVEFKYLPMSFSIGTVISAAAWSGLFISWRRLKREIA